MLLAAREAAILSADEATTSIEALHRSGRISTHLMEMALARVTDH